jgi:hypothetical protein
MSWFGVQIVVRRDSKHYVGRDCNESGCHSSTTSFSKRLAIPSPANPAADPRVDPTNPRTGPRGRIPQK